MKFRGEIMKTKISKRLITIISIPVLIAILTFLYIEKPWIKYHKNGPLALPKLYYTQIGSSNVKVNHSFYFGGLRLPPNKTNITVISIEPTNLPKGISFSFIGFSSESSIGAVTSNDYVKSKEKMGLRSAPLKITGDSSKYKPIIKVSANKPGVYTIQGLLITYKWKGKLYRDYYRDQFSLFCEKQYNRNISLPPEKWEKF